VIREVKRKLLLASGGRIINNYMQDIFIKKQAEHLNKVFNLAAGIEQTDEEILDDKIKTEAREEEEDL